jgi:hypothetical protein
MGSVTEDGGKWVFARELAGYVAMWAVRQSPYRVPEQLEVVLEKFQAEIEECGGFDLASDYKGGMRLFESPVKLGAFLETHLETIPEVQAWNVPKIERASFEAGEVLKPEHDFIDLSALVTNIVLTVFPNERGHVERKPDARKADFGGLGGRAGRRSLNPEDLFEVAVNRALGDRMRAEGVEKAGFYKGRGISARLWGSLANVDWLHENGYTASYAFRAAGDLIAAIIGEGDYMDWYCCHEYGRADNEVIEAMAREGWRPE